MSTEPLRLVDDSLAFFRINDSRESCPMLNLEDILLCETDSRCLEKNGEYD